MTLTEERDQMSATVQATILKLRARMSDKRLGIEIGYADGAVVAQVMRGTCLFGPVQTMRLARLASDLGYDELSDLFCGHGKRCLPAPEVQTDGCTHDEERTAMQALGDASRASDGQDWQEVYESGQEMVAAGYGLMAEAQRNMNGGMPALRIDRGTSYTEAHPHGDVRRPRTHAGQLAGF